jgi:uncharacterized membrane-anchored protein
MKKIKTLIGALLCASIVSAQTDSVSLSDENDTASVSFDQLIAYINLRDSVNNAMKYEEGTVELQNGIAVLTVPAGYKFLGPEQSKYILTEMWGNPPGDAPLGLLFPKDIQPVSDSFSYAVEITYSEEGYIDDEDAEDLDYDDLLKEMQEDTRTASAERITAGYEPIELLGWASPPFYDHENKKLHWAKEIKFGTSEINTLNYNIRVLGRKGYINLNIIGDMTVLAQVKNDITPILSSVEFTSGNEFNPDLDKVAAYGIGGLIAGKVLAKAGFFVVLLKFWKVIAVAVVGGVALFKKKIFGSNS